MFCCDLRRSSSMMTFWANCSEDRVHFLDFVSSILANVGVRPKLWQSRRNSMAPAQWICLELNFSSPLNTLSSLFRFKLLIVVSLYPRPCLYPFYHGGSYQQPLTIHWHGGHQNRPPPGNLCLQKEDE